MYEYLVCEVSSAYDAEKECNRRAQDGWRLVSTNNIARNCNAIGGSGMFQHANRCTVDSVIVLFFEKSK